ncbi:AraC family transcriptional regulator [Pseudomonas sp. ML96]|uniref:helix-turn-helix domain-containing protein n=1 Tax=Pseudomonas sp. ML96 TaxID=1523503 RepID=UPI0006893659|nr:AraC family transcriptional regulator [Pseudomonas sp. ML96]
MPRTSAPQPAPAAESIETFWRDPALPHVESRRACHSRACYRPHSHPSVSIGAVDEGNSLFSGAADTPVALHPGTLVFVPAQRVHACNPARDKAWSYQMLYLDAAWLQALRHEYALAPLAADEPVRIVDDPALYARFCQLNTLLFSAAAASDKEAALIEFIGDCDASQARGIEVPGPSAVQTQRLQPAFERLQQAPAADVPLQELAQLAGMSRYQLIRSFRAATGMTPHAWQLNLCINLAKERLLAGASLADVAYGLGFADQAHLQRVFKAHTGITPGRFRA